MVKKKKFIDKKKSTTYYLTFNGPDEEGAQKQSPDAAEGGPPFDEADSELTEMFGLASIFEDLGYELSDEKRREIISLGLADDGYDYLQHLREPVRRAPPDSRAAPPVQVLDPAQLQDQQHGSEVSGDETAQAAQARQGAPASGGTGGPSVYLAAPKFKAPAEDTRLVDARALRVAGVAQEEADAEATLPTISAFTRTAPAIPAKLLGTRPGPSASSHAAAALPAAAPLSAAITAMALGFRGRVLTELEELEQSMQELEKELQSDEDEQQGRGKGGQAQAVWPLAPEEPLVPEAPEEFNEAKVQVLGDKEWADWLDNFVVLASAAAPDEGPSAQAAAHQQQPHQQRHRHTDEQKEDGDGAQRGSSGDEDDNDERGEMEGNDAVSQGPMAAATGAARAGTAAAAHGSLWDAASQRSRRLGGAASRAGAGGGLIASTCWCPERQDRNEGLQSIDEQFEELALQYDEEEALGQLDDEEQVAQARGTADIRQYESVMDEFLQEERKHKLVGSGAVGALRQLKLGGIHSNNSVPDAAAGEDGEEEGDEEEHAAPPAGFKAPASRKVEALDDKDEQVIAATRARLVAAAASGNAAGAEGDALPDTLGTVVVDRGERWDCESVLSLRSNLENHPGRIVEPQARAGGRAGGRIELSRKTGMPVLVGNAGAAVPESIPEEMEGSAAASFLAGDEGQEEDDEEDEAGSGGEKGATVVVFERRKGETVEERRARKAAFKEAKRAGRAAKKELKGLFKSETARQKKQAAGRAAAGGGVGMGTSTYTLH